MVFKVRTKLLTRVVLLGVLVFVCKHPLFELRNSNLSQHLVEGPAIDTHKSDVKPVKHSQQIPADIRRIPKAPAKLTLSLSLGSNFVWCQFVTHTLKSLDSGLFQDRRYFTSKTDKVVLLVDGRETLAHVWTIPWALSMVGPDWSLQILTKNHAVGFYQSIVQNFNLDNVYIDTFEERYGYGTWVPDDFMSRVQFMVASQFWDGIRGEYIVVIQDNGVPMRRWDHPDVVKTLQELFTYGYAGAPWNLEEGSAPGGNGGFSFRRRSVLMRHAVDLNIPYESLLSRSSLLKLGTLGTDNEDAVLGNILHRVDHGVAPKDLEHKFSCELLFHPEPMGVHHFAPRHSSEETATLVELGVKEFFSVGLSSSVIELDRTGRPNISQVLSPWKFWQEKFPKTTLPLECMD